jgi:hypothetical protein
VTTRKFISGPRRGERPLVDIEVAGPETGLRVGQVQLPHSWKTSSKPNADTASRVRRTLPPQPQRLGVVRPQRQHVHRAQPCVPFGDADDRSRRRQQPPGKMYFWIQV